jgi:hypothetical protein
MVGDKTTPIYMNTKSSHSPAHYENASGFDAANVEAKKRK